SALKTVKTIPLPVCVLRGVGFEPNSAPHSLRYTVPAPAARSASMFIGMVSVARGFTRKFAFAVAVMLPAFAVTTSAELVLGALGTVVSGALIVILAVTAAAPRVTLAGANVAVAPV